MTLFEKLPKYAVVAALAGGVAVMGYQLFAPTQITASVNVRVPELSVKATAGKQAFDANCAQCHGKNASGTDRGPPLVHDIYNPGHHSDAAFLFATKRGVSQHHWPYGNMPPQPQVTEEQITAIVQYVRELQMENGIKFKKHMM